MIRNRTEIKRKVVVDQSKEVGRVGEESFLDTCHVVDPSPPSLVRSRRLRAPGPKSIIHRGSEHKHGLT